MGLPANDPRRIEFAALYTPVFNQSYTPLHTLTKLGQSLPLMRAIHHMENEGKLDSMINAKCTMGATPLLLATQAMVTFSNLKMLTDYPFVIRILLHHGADPNIPESLNNSTPLHNAAQFSVNIVETLVENGAKVNLQDQEGNTPLHLAIKSNNEQANFAANYLLDNMLKNAIDPNAVNANGETPLYLAQQNEKKDLISKLLKNTTFSPPKRHAHKLS